MLKLANLNPNSCSILATLNMQLFCTERRKKAIGMGTKEKEDAAKKSTPTTDANDTDTQG